MSFTHATRYGCSSVMALAMVTFLAAPASAQNAPADPNPGKVTVTAGMDLLNQYMFRGIRQNATEVAMWPYADLGLALYSGDGGLKSVGLNLGSWNSLHTGDTGSDGPSGKLWYEGDFYATLGLGLGGGVSLGTTYTAYTSPNNMFSTVKEVAFKLGVDDSAYLGRGALRPYALVAFEMDTAPGLGQADAGENGGTYVELGVAPGWAAEAVGLAFPVKVGLSAGDYYELNGVDNKFGYFSIGAIATVPLGGTTSFGAWNVHGGVEYQRLGDTTAAINLDDDGRPQDNQVIASFGFGLSY
ncbi:MAG: hypothetical protein ACRD3C_06620 [Vicinamibacterales bacterium]